MAMVPSERSEREGAAELSRQAFGRLSEPLRREIKLHCYRMMGSLHEAEDLVQETYLRAWRGFDRFDGSAPRAWLYKIATNVCLNALASRRHAERLLPDQLGPASAPKPPGGAASDVAWLEPYPDAQIGGIVSGAPGPEARYSAREAVQLAFVAGIQQLPPRQRAALMLCDVLGWTAADAAELVGGTTASINSALQRARETLAKRYPEGRPSEALRPNATQEELLGRYLHAWEGHDVDGFVALLKEDATAIMPPWLEWYAGRGAIRVFFEAAWKSCRSLHLVPTAANGQPAFAVYERSADGQRWEAHSIHVVTLENETISALTLFIDPNLFDSFGLPSTLPPPAHP